MKCRCMCGLEQDIFYFVLIKIDKKMFFRFPIVLLDVSSGFEQCSSLFLIVVFLIIKKACMYYYLFLERAFRVIFFAKVPPII